MDHGDTIVNLFLGNELEGGVANLYLRRLNADAVQYIELLGPRSPTRFERSGDVWTGSGEWSGIRYTVQLRLVRQLARVVLASEPGKFCKLGAAGRCHLCAGRGAGALRHGAVERVLRQPVRRSHALVASEAGSRGGVSAESGGRRTQSMVCDWLAAKAESFATDAMQVHGLATRAGEQPVGIVQGLPARRLQHEHSTVAIQDERLHLEPGERVSTGFFGSFSADHPAATSTADLDAVDQALALPEAALIGYSNRSRRCAELGHVVQPGAVAEGFGSAARRVERIVQRAASARRSGRARHGAFVLLRG